MIKQARREQELHGEYNEERECDTYGRWSTLLASRNTLFLRRNESFRVAVIHF
jgi:hypothetical protein